MKKLIYCVAALATALFAGSCQQELLDTAGSSTVTYTVEVPGVATKAIGDATNVNQLIYEVWRTGTAKDITLDQSAADAAEPRTEFLYRKTAEVNNRVATFDVDLVKDQNYTILFWAHVVDAAGVNAYYNTGDLRSVTLTDETLGAFNEARAAFYGIDFIEAGKQKAQQKVTLTRPFAQVNLGTVERNAQAMGYDLTVAHTSVTIKGASKKFNVATGVASAEPADCADLTFASKAPFMNPVEKLNGTYEWIAMDYIFVPANQATLAVDYTITTNHGVVSNSISNLPTQKNYRTNIVGNLLTSKTDYTVELSKDWAGADIMYEIWDGKTVSEPAYDEATKTYTIKNGSELAWLAAAVNGILPETNASPAADSFAGKTFKLIDNVDLGNNEWTPIGNSTNPFKGTFDGNEKTVKNLVIYGNNDYVGLFGFTTDGTIKNLKIENAKVSGRVGVGVVAGSPYTSSYEDITVKGHVEVNGMSYVGGVCGYNAYADFTNIVVEVDETSYVKANSVENGTAYRTYVGGVVGFNGEGGHTFTNITSNINVEGSTMDVGGLFGIAHYGNQFINCSCSGNVAIYAAPGAAYVMEIGGIAGVWHNGGADVVMTRCEFTGTVTTNIDRETVWYNNLVGRPYSASGTGRLIIDDNVVVASANTLQAAINGAKDGETIKLVDDITVSETSDLNGNVVYYTGDKSFTIDLNGKEVKGNTSNVVFRFQKAEGEVNTITIKNGTVEALENCWSAISIGSSASTKTKVNLSNLTVKSQKANDMAVRARSGAEFTMTDCIVIATESAGGICAGGGNVTLNNVTVNQTGWYSNNWNSVALGISGGAKMTVNSGAYTSNPDGDPHGTWVAYVMSSGGILEINGGTFNGTPAGDANSANACGLICADAKSEVYINGGEFNSTGAILDIRNNSGQTPNPKAVLAGGTFSADPRISGLYASNLISVAEGKGVVEGTDGRWTLVKVQQNNEIWYTSAYNQNPSNHYIVTPTIEEAFGDAIYQGSSYDEELGVGIITFDKELTTIGNEAFKRNTNTTPSNWMTSISLPNNVKTIGNYAFAQCFSLTSITIPDSVTTIGQYAFQSCNAATSVTIGSGVNSIGSGAFYNSYEINQIICKSTTPPKIADKWVFYGIDTNITVIVPADSVDAYKAADFWKNFKNIVAE